MLGDHGSNLSHLIGFRHVTLSLKVNQIFHTFSYKDMVTSPTPFRETEPCQQVSQIVEADVRVRSSAEDSLKNFRVRRHLSTSMPDNHQPLSAEFPKG
jgi:hypothetical protein